MHYLITDAANELSRELIRQLSGGGHTVTGLVKNAAQAQAVAQTGATPSIADPADAREMARAIKEAGAKIILNLAPQRSNTLLHDGHAWRGIDERLPAQTAVLIQAANENQISFLLHTSYAFLYGPGKKKDPKPVDESAPVMPTAKNDLFAAAIKAEKMVAANKQFPVCIMRTGYLYGPQSRDLALYRNAVKIHRPYYAGSKKHVGNYVHFSDAAWAIMLAAEQRPANEIINVVDGAPVSFGTFIDTYAKLLGFRKPLRIPRTLLRPVPYFITLQQIKQLDIRGAAVDNRKARELLGWTAQFPNYELGLAQTVRELSKD